MSISEVWIQEKIKYQQRYIQYLKKCEAGESEYLRGHLNECSYVLRNIFGLSNQQMREIEHNYSGFTNEDIE